jgi:hypothetical protein
MTQITIEINDSLLSKAIIESQAKKVSLSDFINNSLETILREPPEVNKISVAEILQNTIERVKELESGKTFLLVDMCKKENWNALNSGERKQFGKIFRKEVEDGQELIAKHIDRTTSNKAIYQRT